VQDTWKSIRITKKDRGLDANRPYLQPPDRTDRSFSRTRTCSWCIKSAGFRASKGSSKMQNGERRSRGSQRHAHQQWRQTEVAGFRRSTPAGVAAGAALSELLPVAAARGVGEDGRGWGWGHAGARGGGLYRCAPLVALGTHAEKAAAGAPCCLRPMGFRRAGGRAGAGGADWVGPLARPNPVDFLFFSKYFFSSARTNSGNAQKMFRDTKKYPENHKNSRKIPRDRLRHEQSK
jgi:hypothetical protein